MMAAVRLTVNRFLLFFHHIGLVLDEREEIGTVNRGHLLSSLSDRGLHAGQISPFLFSVARHNEAITIAELRHLLLGRQYSLFSLRKKRKDKARRR